MGIPLHLEVPGINALSARAPWPIHGVPVPLDGLVLPYGVGREVIVVHISLEFFIFIKSVGLLCFGEEPVYRYLKIWVCPRVNIPEP